jgi:hypothetical protein
MKCSELLECLLQIGNTWAVPRIFTETGTLGRLVMGLSLQHLITTFEYLGVA